MNERITAHRMFPGQTAPLGVRKNQEAASRETDGSKSIGFRELLNEKSLHFSSHAAARMRQRGITFQPEQLTEIATAIDRAEAKGAKDSLVLFRDIAMIVNVPTRTVVTAIEGNAMQGSVFTQIDSAVVIS
ncbi:flagellar biosynthesis protein [Paenibacillaceae bacterium]|nr:flagellar biosynthesis protein [Paenibacillaceae bacterium]